MPPEQLIAGSGGWPWRTAAGIALSLLLLGVAVLLGWREMRAQRDQAALESTLVIAGIERQLRERLLRLAADLSAHGVEAVQAGSDRAIRHPQPRLHATPILRTVVTDAQGRLADGSVPPGPALPPRGDGLQLLQPEPGADALLALWDGTPGIRVLAEVDPRWFAELLQGHALADDTVLNLVHASQRLYARVPDDDGYRGRSLAETVLFGPEHGARETGRYSGASILSGQERQFVYQRVAGTPLAIVVSTPGAGIAALWRFFITELLLAALVLGAIWLSLLRAFDLDRQRQARLLARLQHAQRLAGLGTWRWRIDAQTIEWSGESARIYGFPPETQVVPVDEVVRRIHPDDQARVAGWMEAAKTTGPDELTGLSFEYRVVRDDGSLGWVLAHFEADARSGELAVQGVQQDVTAQAELRERLRSTEAEYRYLFERNPVPMWIFDRDTLAFLAVNDAMLRHYGYDREELLAGSILDIRPQNERAQVEAAAGQAGGERPQGRVWTHQRKDGTCLRAAIYTREIRFGDRPAAMVAAHDVSEREASETRFRLVARATSDAIYDYNVTTGDIWWGRAFYSAFKLNPHEMPASLAGWEARVHPDDLARVSASLERALQDADSEEWEEEYRFRRGDDEYAVVVDRGCFVRDATGCTTRMVGGMLDITERRQRQSELRLLRRAVEAIRSGILIADVRQPDFPAVYVNRGFVEMTGYSVAEVIGRDSRFLDFDPRDLDTVKEIRRCLHERRELHTLLRIRRKDGTTFWNDLYMAPVQDDAGQVTHMLSVSTDVSEHRAAEERFRLVARATSDVVWDWDITNDVTWRSDNVFSLFGYEHDEIVGSSRGWSALVHPDDRGRVEASVRDAIDSGDEGWSCDYRVKRRDGSYAEVMDRGYLIRDEAGMAVRAVGGMLDLTQQHRDAADLRLLRQAVEATDNGIVIADARQPDMPLVYVNPAFERMTGYAAAECIGRNCRFLQGDDRQQMDLEALRMALREGEEERVVLRNYRKDGTLFWNELHMAPVRGGDGVVSHFVGVQSDVSHRHVYEQELAHRATHDQLTGLPNRQLLLDRLQQAMRNADRYGRKAGVVFIDLDDFKLINDNLDHAAGDVALRQVAERLQLLTRETDTVGRFGGDEFVLVLTEQVSEDGIGQVIRRITDALVQPLRIEGIEHVLTASVGWCRYPEDGNSAEALLKRADMAMYEAKRRGRNTAVAYSRELDLQASKRLQLVAQLRDALLKNEFVLVFQPLYDRTGRVEALEALVRWQHPERGLLPPGEFISVCEESGLIVELGRRVLREAARHHQLLEAAGHAGLRLSVNVSALQFGYSLEHDVATVMEEHGLPRETLELEITESVIMQNPELAIETMKQIAALGACLAIDDFGTGYSSLAYLKRLPIHRLKIDRSFVKDLPDEQEAASICNSIIGLAHSLGLKTVAEGVETEAQREWLCANGCDAIQGYLMARPAPFADVLDLLAANRDNASA